MANKENKKEIIKNLKLKKYIPLIDFLEAILGKNSEVVLHDLKNLDESVVAIRNGHISNREVGAPATDLVLKILQEHREDMDFITNYSAKGKFNKKLNSSTFFIKEEGELIGMICVNTDQSIYEDLEKALKKIQENYKKEEEKIEDTTENLSLTIEEMAQEAITEVLAVQNVSIEYLKQKDKQNIIEELYNKGIFLMKGAVVEVAKTLGMSEASVYRYVQMIKKKN